MTRLMQMLTTAAALAVLAAPSALAAADEFVPGVSDFPRVESERTQKFVPGVTDFPRLESARAETYTAGVTDFPYVPVAATGTTSPVGADTDEPVTGGIPWAEVLVAAAGGAALATLLLLSGIAVRRRTTAHA